jgi:hypothetical protein
MNIKLFSSVKRGEQDGGGEKSELNFLRAAAGIENFLIQLEDNRLQMSSQMKRLDGTRIPRKALESNKKKRPM